MNALSYAFSKSFSTVTKYSGVYVEEKKNNKDLHLLPLTKKKKCIQQTACTTFWKAPISLGNLQHL